MQVEHSVIQLNNMREHDPREVPFEEFSTCPICQSKQLSDISKLKNSLISSWCCHCQHVFHRRIPDKQWFKSWYQSNWDPYKKINLPIKNIPWFLLKRRLKRSYGQFFKTDKYLFLKDVAKAGDKVLDIGCGFGMNLLPFDSHGCETYGIELSKHRAEFSKRLGINVQNIGIEDLDRRTFGCDFDLIFSNHVLEHVHNPHEFMEVLKKVIKPGGHLGISVPNFETDFLYQQFFFVLHIHCYTRHSLSHLLTQHGFFIRRILEDNQIRVLAIYDPEKSKKMGALKYLNQDVEPPTQLILNRAFGLNFDKQKDKPMSCRWSVLPGKKKIDQTYKIHYETDDHPRPKSREEKLIAYRLSGPDTLPIEFNQANSHVPFWVK